MFPTRRSLTALLCVAVLATALTPRNADARVRLESICSVYGQKPIRLTGIGLVVGLDGTGDGSGSGPSIEAVTRALDLMGNPAVQTSIRDADNVAIVVLEATVPAEAVRIGQALDVHVSSILSAESLRGGRLVSAPLMLAGDRRSKVVLATAAGGIAVEDESVATTGRIASGAIVEANLFEEEQFLKNVFIDNPHSETSGKMFKLMLNPSHAGFTAAANIATAINNDFRDIDEKYGENIATAAGPGLIHVAVPHAYSETPIEFIADVLDVGIDRAHTQARVVVNTRTNSVIITGEAAISPISLSHPGLQVEVGPSFRTLVDPQDTANNTQLKQLVAALGQLQVSAPDIVNIVRDLNASGKLHATYIER